MEGEKTNFFFRIENKEKNLNVNREVLQKQIKT